MRPLNTPAAAGVLISASLLLAGCATPQFTDLLERRPSELPERVEIDSVPFYPQELYQCGPAALATTLVHAGVATSPDALVQQVYLPGREGSLQAEMLAAARRHGLVPYRLEARLEHVLRELAAGRPVIVFQNLSFAFAPLWHYAVAVGYDLSREEIVLRSGTTRRLVMTLSNFERTWARAEYWAMTALPPPQLPATATEDRYVASVVALERVAPEAASRAYATALRRWPDSLLARIGQGNAAYAMRDLHDAETAYREAVRRHPGAADAWNNLAQTLLERQRREEALAAAQRAVAIGGPRLAQYRATLKAITDSR
ncbi:MAG: PA2778 family cysteine peptidase [Betaproteobacteria bacterium]|nr:PA2778 family cysteine peptidase [Betaproteobacteria bacterium]